MTAATVRGDGCLVERLTKESTHQTAAASGTRHRLGAIRDNPWLLSRCESVLVLFPEICDEPFFVWQTRGPSRSLQFSAWIGVIGDHLRNSIRDSDKPDKRVDRHVANPCDALGMTRNSLAQVGLTLGCSLPVPIELS